MEVWLLSATIYPMCTFDHRLLMRNGRADWPKPDSKKPVPGYAQTLHLTLLHCTPIYPSQTLGSRELTQPLQNLEPMATMQPEPPPTLALPWEMAAVVSEGARSILLSWGARTMVEELQVKLCSAALSKDYLHSN